MGGLLVDSNLSSLNGEEEWELSSMLDSGATTSCLLIPTDNAAFLQGVLSDETAIIEVADGRKVTASHSLRGKLTLIGEGGEERHTRTVKLWVLINKEYKETHIVLGKDLLELFGIDILKGHTAVINKTILADHNETFNDADLKLFTIKTNTRTYPLPHELLHMLEPITTLDDDIFEADISHDHTQPRPMNPREEKFHIEFRAEPNAPAGRPILSIPWKNQERPPLNFEQCYARDKKVCQKLTKEESKLYQDAVNILIEEQFAQVLDPMTDRIGHFIPVRPVFKTDRSTTKCRLCLDARTINGFTRTGEQTGEKIIQCLWKFRSTPQVGTFDLSKAFWQIKLREDENHFFSTVINGTPIKFRAMVFGANFSPSALQQTLETLLQDTGVDHTHYVDDFIICHDDPTALTKDVETTRELLQKHGFPSAKVAQNGIKMPEPTKYLSYSWDTETDTLQTKPYQVRNNPEPATRAQLAEAIMSLYDPLGIRLATQLAGRMLLRESVEGRNTNDNSNPWKQRISGDLQTKLNDWVQEANKIHPPVPRYVDTSTLHIFCDASFQAWAVTAHGKDLELLCARGGLLNKGVTIPRAELLALFMATSLAEELIHGLTTKPKQVIILTDNEPSIHRLRNPKLDAQQKVYELNRITKIRAIIRRIQAQHPDLSIDIRHIAGELNLADGPTRPATNNKHGEAIALDDVQQELTNTKPYMYNGEHKNEEFSLCYMKLRERKQPTVTGNESPKTLPKIKPLECRTNPEKYKTELLTAIKLNQTRLENNPSLQPNETGILQDSKGVTYLHPTEPTLLHHLVRLAHGTESGHHYGHSATMANLRREYRWKKMSRDIHHVIKNCPTCERARLPRLIRTAVGDSQIWLKTLEAFGIAGIIGLDICQVAGDDDHIGFITTVCSISKWIRATAITGQTAEEIIVGLDGIFQMTVYPAVIVTDGAPAFKSKRFQTYCIKHSIHHLVSPPHAPAYHGWYERGHKSLLDQLRLLVLDHPDRNWVELMSLAQYLVNTRPYSTTDPTGLCPLHLIFPSSAPGAGSLQHLPDKGIVGELQRCGLHHLINQIPDKYKQAGERAHKRQKSLMDKYHHIFEEKRSKIRERLTETLKRQPKYTLEAGTYARVYRPKACKIAPVYSEPRRIVSEPSAATRLVEQFNGRTTVEYIANLVPCKNPNDMDETTDISETENQPHDQEHAQQEQPEYQPHDQEHAQPEHPTEQPSDREHAQREPTEYKSHSMENTCNKTCKETDITE